MKLGTPTIIIEDLIDHSGEIMINEEREQTPESVFSFSLYENSIGYLLLFISLIKMFFILFYR